MEQSEKLLLTVAEAAKLCSIGKTKAYELVAAEEWPTVRIGKCVRISRAGLEQWVAQQTEGQIKQAG